jgi:hypothetical protein
MKLFQIIASVAVASAAQVTYNPEAHNLYNDRARALQVHKDRRYTFKGADNYESAKRAMCKMTWRTRDKILECMKDHGTYPRYYEDNLEKKQDFALTACENISNPAQKRKCYRDITSNTQAGTNISTQSEPSKYDRVQ